MEMNRVRITHPRRDELMEDLAARLAQGRGFTLATLNLDHIVKLRSDARFQTAYLAQTHVVADGNPIVWLGRLAGQAIDLIPGSELVEPLAAQAARAGVPVAFVGSTEPVLEQAARVLKARHPGLQVSLCLSPSFGFDPDGTEAAEVVRRIGMSGAGLCLLALGAPRQEIFAARAAPALPRCGFASIGAGLDFIAGHQVRAPFFARAVAMEWAWRLASDPRRLGARYFRCAAALPGLAGGILRDRNRS